MAKQEKLERRLASIDAQYKAHCDKARSHAGCECWPLGMSNEICEERARLQSRRNALHKAAVNFLLSQRFNTQ